jgi:hypothetical protein
MATEGMITRSPLSMAGSSLFLIQHLTTLSGQSGRT